MAYFAAPGFIANGSLPLICTIVDGSIIGIAAAAAGIGAGKWPRGGKKPVSLAHN